MAKPNRNDLQILNDRIRIATLYLNGTSQDQIAKQLSTADRKMTQQMVSYDLKAIKDKWKERYSVTIENLEETRAVQMSKLEHLYKQNLESFRLSQLDSKSELEKKHKKKKKRKRAQANANRLLLSGDQKFLAGALDCVEEQNKLLGIYPPERRELTGAGGGPVEITDARQRLISRIASIASRQKTKRASSKHQ